MRSQKSKWMLLTLSALSIILAACLGNSAPASNNFPQTRSPKHKLVVYVLGLNESLLDSDAAQNDGYGYTAHFYAPGAIQPYLQGTNDFKDAQSMVFSYRGFTPGSGGKPNPFPCTDSFNNKLDYEAGLLSLQINQYLDGHPDTDVYIVAHSLGGVITFAYMVSQIENSHSTSLENGGLLKGIAILDSPLGGVTDASEFYNFLIQVLGDSCNLQLGDLVDYTAVKQLQTIFHTASSSQHQGETASIESVLGQSGGGASSNQQVALDAARAGVTLLIIGNINDLMWQPGVCRPTLDFLTTQYLKEAGKQGKGALYSRWFSSGQYSCDAALNNLANHLDVLKQTNVEKAIWEAFTNQNVDQLQALAAPPTPAPTATLTPTPTVTPIPPTPTDTEVPPTPTQAPVPTIMAFTGTPTTVPSGSPVTWTVQLSSPLDNSGYMVEVVTDTDFSQNPGPGQVIVIFTCNTGTTCTDTTTNEGYACVILGGGVCSLPYEAWLVTSDGQTIIQESAIVTINWTS